jgi:hypothetical protein
MSFKDKTYDERIKDRHMWNHSERAFEANWPYRKIRFGFDNDMDDADFDTWACAPFVRHAPDYQAQVVPRGQVFFVEVQGTGKDRLHKFKQGKLDQLKLWNQHQDVWFWLWDNNLQTGTMISLNKIMLLIAQGKAKMDKFDGHRIYYAIHVDEVVSASDWVPARYE